MTSNGKCESCGTITSFYRNAPPIRGWFCRARCEREFVASLPLDTSRLAVSAATGQDTVEPPIALKPVQAPPIDAEEEARLLARFEALKESGQIVTFFSDPHALTISGYGIKKIAATKIEAAQLAERFDRAEKLPVMMQLAFVNGMLDGIKTYRREIAKLGELYRKAGALGDRLVTAVTESKV